MQDRAKAESNNMTIQIFDVFKYTNIKINRPGFTLVDASVQRGGACPKTSDYLTLAASIGPLSSKM